MSGILRKCLWWIMDNPKEFISALLGIIGTAMFFGLGLYLAAVHLPTIGFFLVLSVVFCAAACFVSEM